MITTKTTAKTKKYRKYSTNSRYDKETAIRDSEKSHKSKQIARTPYQQ